MLRYTVFAVIASFIILMSCANDINSYLDTDLSNLIVNKEHYILPNEGDLSAIPQSSVNPLTPEKVALGKLLFFEPAFQ